MSASDWPCICDGAKQCIYCLAEVAVVKSVGTRGRDLLAAKLARSAKVEDIKWAIDVLSDSSCKTEPRFQMDTDGSWCCVQHEVSSRLAVALDKEGKK